MKNFELDVFCCHLNTLSKYQGIELEYCKRAYDRQGREAVNTGRGLGYKNQI